MSMQHAPASPLHLTILDYFEGERLEMLTAIIVFVAVAASAAALFFASRSGFAMALMVTVSLLGGGMAVGMGWLMARDQASVRVISQAPTELPERLATKEKARITIVLSKYGYYRFVSAFLAGIALAGFLLSERGWVHGVASGLILVALAQGVIDHYSERRARDYLERLVTT